MKELVNLDQGLHIHFSIEIQGKKTYNIIPLYLIKRVIRVYQELTQFISQGVKGCNINQVIDGTQSHRYPFGGEQAGTLTVGQ